MAEDNQFSAGLNEVFYGSGEPSGNVVFPIKTGNRDGYLPVAPINLTASNSVYTNKILLSWTSSENTKEYLIYRNYEFLTKTTGTPLNDTNDSIIYEDTTAIPGVLYTYTITGINNTGESLQSNPDTGSVRLNSPTNITSTQGTYPDKILISWSSVEYATKYELYKSYENSEESLSLVVSTNELQYEDFEVTPGSTVFYAVKAVSEVDETASVFTSIVSGSTQEIPIPDSPVVSASDGLFSDKVRLTWNSVAGAIFYNVYRNGIKIDESIILEYDDETAEPGVIHTYNILTVTTSNISLYDTDSIDTGFKKLQQSSSLHATKGTSSTNISLTWNKIQGATGYKIYRSTTPESPEQNMVLIDTVGDVYNYTDTFTDLSFGVTYYYSIKAFCDIAEAESDFSNITSGYLLDETEIILPPLPSSFTLTAGDGTESTGVELSWTESTNSDDYIIYRENSGTYEPISNARVNYLKYSSLLTRISGGWLAYRESGVDPTTPSFAASSLLMPDNTTNGTKITFKQNVNNGIYQIIPSVETSTTYTMSIYAVTESGETKFRISYYNGISSSFSPEFTATTTIKRFEWTFITTTNRVSSNVAIGNGQSSSTGTLVFWGAQLEKTNKATSYIETTTQPVMSRTFIDTTASIETVYNYKIKAINGAGNIESNVDSGFRKPITPIITNISRDNNNYIRLTIQTNATQNSTLTIYRGIDSTNDSTNEKEYVQIFQDSITDSITTYDDNDVNLVEDTKYYYKVKTTYNSSDSLFSNEDYGELSKLPVPTSALDYELWAAQFVPENIFDCVASPTLCFTSTSYPFTGIVPMVRVPQSQPSPHFPYGGYRWATVTSYEPTTTNWTKFKNEILSIPEGRRVINASYWWVDLNYLSRGKINYYSNTTDGTEYPPGSGNKLLTIWVDNNLNDCKMSFQNFLRKCQSDNITFDVYFDDRENYGFHWLDGDHSRPGSINAATSLDDFGKIYNAQYDTHDGTNNGIKVERDMRIFSAIINDPRFKTKVNPSTGRTFEQEFINHYKLLWQNHWFYKDIPLPDPFPTAEEILIFQNNKLDKRSFETISNFWTPYGCTPTDKQQAQSINLTTCQNIPSDSGYCGPLGTYNSRFTYRGANSVPDGVLNPTKKAFDYPDWLFWNSNPSYPNVPVIPSDSLYKTGALTAYSIFFFAYPAWNATIMDWLHGYYIKSQVADTFKETEFSSFSNTKFAQYQVYPTNAEEASFYQESNLNPSYQATIQDQLNGQAYYGELGNVIYPTYNMAGESRPVRTNITIKQWIQTDKGRSGYVKSPKNDYEKFAWSSNLDFPYGGPSCNSPNLVRYPETNMADESENWIPQNYNKWIIEIVYKMLVRDIKDTRHVFRSEQNYSSKYIPNITGPSWYNSLYKNSYGYWVEMCYHLFTMNPVFIEYFIENYQPKPGQAYAIQFVLDKWRNITKNSRVTPCSNSSGDITLPVDRIVLEDAFEKCLMSGCKINNSGTYLWRITIPPKFFHPITGLATLKKISNGDDDDLPETIVINSKNDTRSASANNLSWVDANVENSRGVWIKRNVSTPPNYIAVPIDSQEQTDSYKLKDQFFTRIGFAGGNQLASEYGSWGNKIIASYSGQRIASNNSSTTLTRAFAWEENPTNPLNSSPWHNIIYEQVIGPYEWGSRSFFMFFPWGGFKPSSPPGNAVFPEEGYAGATEYLEKKYKYSEAEHIAQTYFDTNGNVKDYQVPAIWKGFKESIKSLIEGKMTPQDGRTSITEPCNVILYLPSFNGYPAYREQTATYWESLADTNDTTDADKDAMFTARLNEYINDLIYMAGDSSIANKGKLYICFDVAGATATPTTLPLFRSLTKLPEHTPRKRYAESTESERFLSGEYRSDTIELADWTVKQALEAHGITVFAEARPANINQAKSSYSSSPRYVGDVNGSYLNTDWTNFISAEYWLWISNPETNTGFSNHITNNQPTIIGRLLSNGLENYWNGGILRDPFGWKGQIHYNGLPETGPFDIARNWSGTDLYYSPYYYQHSLYALSDTYRFYRNLNRNVSDSSDIKLNKLNVIVFDYENFAINNNTVWANNSSSDKTKYYRVSNTNPTSNSSLYFAPEFKPSEYSTNPLTYFSVPNAGFWFKGTDIKDNWNWWNRNIRKPNFNDFIEVLKQVSSTSFPEGTQGVNWNQLYPYDYWSTNILGDLI